MCHLILEEQNEAHPGAMAAQYVLKKLSRSTEGGR